MSQPDRHLTMARGTVVAVGVTGREARKEDRQRQGRASRSRSGYAMRTVGQIDRLSLPSRIQLECGTRDAGQWPTTYVPRTDRDAGCSSVEFDFIPSTTLSL